ncbi:MAG: hypothetical protein WD468_08905 [Pirellulales bacterium]
MKVVLAVVFAILQCSPAGSGELLYNGIQLPDTWPPRGSVFPTALVTPSYLKSPPALIPIDVGRQLLMDDFLIEKTTLKRSFHEPEYYEGNPIIKPDQPWELTSFNYRNQPDFPGPVAGMRGNSPMAMPYSDGVWFDPQDKLFKMWYFGGEGPSPTKSLSTTCYATSTDGIHWEKPKLRAVRWLDVKETNIVHLGKRDSATIWLDHGAKKAGERYKMWLGWALHKSPDGIHWTRVKEFRPAGDRTTFFYNPFRRRWVFSIKAPDGTWQQGLGRTRLYYETENFFRPPKWGSDPVDEKGDVVLWTVADGADPKWEGMEDTPDLYNLDAVAYESMLLGLFTIWRGDTTELRESGRPKLNEVFVGFSRDGFHWDRPVRRPFLPISEKRGDWNWGNVQSAGGCCLVVGDKLYFFVSGRVGASRPGSTSHAHGGSTGLAILRRDGFASMDAGPEVGTLTTRPVKFAGKRLFVNVDADQGELTAEILGEDGKVIEPFQRTNCEVVRQDSTCCSLSWKGATDLSSLNNRPVRFRFHLKNGQLYAFWVSPDETGASHGYVAAGGPDFTGPTDTVGRSAD